MNYNLRISKVDWVINYISERDLREILKDSSESMEDIFQSISSMREREREIYKDSSGSRENILLIDFNNKDLPTIRIFMTIIIIKCINLPGIQFSPGKSFSSIIKDDWKLL